MPKKTELTLIRRGMRVMHVAMQESGTACSDEVDGVVQVKWDHRRTAETIVPHPVEELAVMFDGYGADMQR